jgi:cytochrome P450
MSAQQVRDEVLTFFLAGHETTALARYAYPPFGGGHRICIGNHFALMEGQLLLATIAQRLCFALATPPPIRPTLPLTLRPIRPVTVTVTRRRVPAG